MTDFPAAQHVSVGDVTLAVYQAGPDPRSTDKPAVLLIHGFPELAYSWRYVMAALAGAGYPVIAPDMRGYGRSDVPEDTAAYSMTHLTSDVAAIADAMGLERCYAVGHDWGALVLWNLPFYQPGRFLGFAGLNVAHTARPPIDPISLFRARLGESMYIVQFQKPGCEARLEQDVEYAMRFFMRKPGGRTKPVERVKGEPSKAQELDLFAMLEAGPEHWGGKPLLDDSDYGIYTQAFEKTGFRGALNWYRNMATNWADQARFLVDGKLPVIKEPVLIITADMDQACPAWMADGMGDLCSNLSRVDLKGCGHWSAQEKPAEVSKALLDWLAG